jgi:Ca-activated chloride channel family protein
MADEVTLRSALGRPYLATVDTPQVAYLLLEILPSQAVAQVRMPLNVSFVLDHSGSMKGEKMDRVRRATSRAFELLGREDTASVVVFDHRTNVLIPSGPVTNLADIQKKINGIRDAGGTQIAPAVERGLREIDRGSKQGLPRLVLLTDGQTENERECLFQADQAGKRGVPITALGVGQDWNEDLLIEMANRSGGTADYIASADKIDEYFQTTVQRAQATAIHNANLTLRLVQGVLPRAVWQVFPLISNLGYQPITDRDVSVPLGEVESNGGRTLLIELLVDPRPAGQYRIGMAEVSYDIPAMNLQGGRTRSDIMLTFTQDAGLTSQVTAPVMNIVEKVSAFKLQTRALSDLESGNVAAATQKLQNAVTRLLSQGELELAQTMQQEITNLQQNGQLSSEGQKTMKFGTRKTVRLDDLDLPDHLKQ